jgi:hypothetical protein
VRGEAEAILLLEKDLHKSVSILPSGKRRQMDSKKLGKEIKLDRVELDLTQTQLAERINAKQKSISLFDLTCILA